MNKKIISYIVCIGAFLGCIFLNNPLLIRENIISIGIFICQLSTVILAYAGFMMTLTTIKDKQNNKLNLLAYNYLILSFLELIRIYIFVELTRTSDVPNYDYYTTYLMKHMLEGIMLLIVLNITDEKTNIKVWMSGIAIGMGLAIVMALKEDGVIVYITRHWYKEIECILIVFWLFVYIQNHKKSVYGEEFTYIKKSIIVKIIYLIGMLSKRSLFNSSYMLILCIIHIIYYIYVYEFLYYITMKYFWHSTDKTLNTKQSELEQEELERHNLVFASHALKYYVNVIEHDIVVLKKKMEKGCESKSLLHLEKIKNNCNRLMKLSNNILDLGQMDMGNMKLHYQLTNMNQLIEVLVESILPYVESRGLQIEIKEVDKSIYCYVDPDEIERVLLNLISNAIKYSKPNGKINVYINEKQGRAYICIEDTGIGIPDEKLEGIFDRFERVETGFARRQEGSGLGLAIVKSIIERHQGQIQMHSKENQGTLVSFNLPIYGGQKNKQVDRRTKANLKRKIEVEFADLKR